MIAPATTSVYSDYSAIAALAECPRRYYYAVERGFVPKGESIHLHTGRVLHAGLHELYATGWDVEEAVRVIHDEWGSVRAPAERAHLTAGHCEIILRNYADDRKGDALQPLRLRRTDLVDDHIVSFEPSVDDDGYIVFAETPIAVKLSDTLVYAGLIDLPASLHGELYIVDHKTTGQWVTERWARKYARSYQLKGYVAILEKLLGRRVAGIYVNGIYTGKEAADDKSKWSKRTSSRSRMFGPFVYSPAEIDEVQSWATGWIHTRDVYSVLAASLDARGLDPALAWPQNDRACDFCAFEPICGASPAAREAVIRMKYKERVLTGVLASGADSDD